jgi:pentapeptide MXKDX repeat protein
MRNTMCRLLFLGFLAASLAAFAQNGDTTKQDNMKPDQTSNGQTNSQMSKNGGKTNKKSTKSKNGAMQKDGSMQKDNGMKNDNMKHDEGMKQN